MRCLFSSLVEKVECTKQDSPTDLHPESNSRDLSPHSTAFATREGDSSSASSSTLVKKENYKLPRTDHPPKSKNQQRNKKNAHNAKCRTLSDPHNSLFNS